VNFYNYSKYFSIGNPIEYVHDAIDQVHGTSVHGSFNGSD
jgi:hypothetical protein